MKMHNYQAQTEGGSLERLVLDAQSTIQPFWKASENTSLYGRNLSRNSCWNFFSCFFWIASAAEGEEGGDDGDDKGTPCCGDGSELPLLVEYKGGEESEYEDMGK
jgi:hypothetical protein